MADIQVIGEYMHMGNITVILCQFSDVGVIKAGLGVGIKL